MGFSPREVDLMSFEEFEACIEGYRAANDPEYRPALTDAEFADIEAMFDAAPETTT